MEDKGEFYKWSVVHPVTGRVGVVRVVRHPLERGYYEVWTGPDFLPAERWVGDSLEEAKRRLRLEAVQP